MIWIKKTVFTVIFVLISIFVGIALVEFGLRLMSNSTVPIRAIGWNILRNVDVKFDIEGLYPSDHSEVRYFRKLSGLRDNCEDPSKIKILTVGGSTTDQRVIQFEKTFQFQLQNRIENYIGEKFCVSNAGYDGHSTDQHVFLLEEYLPEIVPDLRPEILLFYIGINDAPYYAIVEN